MRDFVRVFFLVFALADIAGLSSAASSEKQCVAITHVTLVDGTGREPQTDQTVVILDERIVSVGSAKEAVVPKQAKVIDGRGKYLTPGLWDMHVHLAGVSADPAWSRDVLLPLLLAKGVTGVRDMGGDLEVLKTWNRQVQSGELIGPHILASGPWLAGGGKKSPEQFPVANAEEARAAVRELKRRGADFIKILTLPSREAFFAVAEEAKKQNLPFVGHLPIEVNAAEASRAGMKGIEHLYYSSFALSVSSKEEELRKKIIQAETNGDFAAAEQLMNEAIATYSAEKAAALWKILQENGTSVTPTLAGIYAAGHPQDWKLEEFGYVPPKLAEEWRGIPKNEKSLARAAAVAKQAEDDWKLTREMHHAGVNILVGSDSLDEGMIPGFSLYDELNQLRRTGFSPTELLAAATRGAARFAGQERDYGNVEAGKYADLLLLTKNPLEDLSGALQDLDTVIFHGRIHDRQDLQVMLKKARETAAAVQ